MKHLLIAIAALSILPTSGIAATDSTPSVAADSQPAPAPAATPAAAAAPAAAGGEVKLGPDGKPIAQPQQGGNLANAVLARTPEEQAKQSGFQVQIGAEHWLGVGTFVDMRYYSYLAVNFSAVVLYQFNLWDKRFRASASGRLTYEYTLPDNETGRRTTFYDTRLGLSAPALFKEKATGIAFTPSLGLTVPTSPESFNAGLITAVSASIAATRSVGRFDFNVSASAARAFFTSPQNNFKATTGRDANGVLLAACRSGETACAGGAANGLYTIAGGATVNWRITDDLILTAIYQFIRGYGADLVPAGGDQYTPKALDSNGNPVARSGLTPRDRTFGVIDLGYQLNDHYSVDLSVSTIQLPLTSTGLVRFPFFSFGSLADNSTSVNLGLTGAF